MRKIIFISLLFWGLSVRSQEIAQWRGPARDGIYPETGLLKQWPANGPTLKLKIEGFGKGYSQPVIYQDKIFIAGLMKDSLDVVSCYKMTGELVWSKPYGKAWKNSYPEVRSTPTIENMRIYMVSGTGEVVCLDATTGKILWSQAAHDKFHGEYNKWGIAESVLLTDKAALYVTGGSETSVVAFDKLNGKMLWKTKSLGGTRAYASSILIDWAGKKMVIATTANDIMGIDADNGEILWSYNLIQYHPGESGKGGNTITPIFHNGEIFTTSGYDHPATLFKLAKDGKSVTLKWKNDTLDTHHGGVVLVDGNLYGSNMQDLSKGRWVSVNWETGRVNWEKDWFTKGSIVSADGLLYCYEERQGHVALVQPDTKDFKIISSFRVNGGEGPYWAHPVIYNGLLFLRHGSALMIYNIK
jgi:outer membrane protein assembly factor BamB